MFRLFSELSPKLRMLIWEAALYQETEYRLVPVEKYSRTIYPMKRLVSPLLSANRESRAAAKKFYNLVLAIYRFPSTLLFYSREYPREAPVGKLYVHLDRDIFTKNMNIYHGDLHLLYQKHMGTPLFPELERMCNYSTESLSDDDCRRIQRSFTIEIFSDEWPPDVDEEDGVLVRRQTQQPHETLFNETPEKFKLMLLSGGIARWSYENSEYQPLINMATVIQHGGEEIFTNSQACIKSRIDRMWLGEDGYIIKREAT
ncbi:hypothetical protein F5Y04DRAFT_286203 [Hypomontagnella monticulosa]|nr:hypothetical protein F5Y04DRAFT_286203 [Hypomontagnella monticulosa]